MTPNDLTATSMNAAEAALGSGPLTMVNLLWFRDEPTYDADFSDAKPDVRSAYYEGYASAFVQTAQALGVEGVEVVLAAGRTAGLVADDTDDWDDIVVVRYRSYSDFRNIVESEQYLTSASPHRAASVANWRLIATKTL